MAFTDLFTQPGSPHWWLLRLDQQLEDRNRGANAYTDRGIKRYEDYYEGDQELAFAALKYQSTFGELFSALSSNWCKLIVDTSVERLRIDGFRFGDESTGDRDAWSIWQANGLDADSVLAHTESVKCGEACVLVAPGSPPLITVEHPSQVFVEHVAGSTRRRAAALKKWTDSVTGRVYATVYLPTGIYKFEKADASLTSLVLPMSYALGRGGWEERRGVPFEERNPLGVVPVIPLPNDRHLLKGGRSDLDDVIPLQDAINKTITDAMVASESQAMPQRWATGLEVPIDPVTKKPRTDLFLASAGSVWSVANKDTKFGQFAAGDLQQYAGLSDLLVRHLSAQSRTPPHYLVGEVVNVSGDALKAAETGLWFKTERKKLQFADPWEEVMRLAFLLSGDERKARETRAETIWGESESRSWGELVDAAVKMRTLSIPYEAIWEFLGFTQTQIETFRKTVNLPAPPADETSPTSGDAGDLESPATQQ